MTRAWRTAVAVRGGTMLLTVSLVLWAASITLAQVPSSLEIPRPQWSVGDWWEFENASGTWRLTVVARESDHYVLARSSRGAAVQDGHARTTYHADLDGWITKTIARDGKVTASGDKHEWVKFPLSLGKRWFFSAMSTMVGRSKTDLRMFDYDCRAEGWDTIDIGGRSVRAIKISYTHGQRGFGPSITGGITGWYAPEAKRLVRLTPQYTGGPTVNVIAFGARAGDAPVIASPSPPVAVPPPAATAAAQTVSAQVELRLIGPPDTTIRLGGDRALATLNADGHAVVRLPPGEHTLEARREGFIPQRTVVTLQPGITATHRVVLSPATPPTVIAIAPKSGEIVRDAEATVSLEARSPQRLRSIDVAGSLFSAPSLAPGEVWRLSATVKLVEGENSLRIVARDEYGATSETMLTLRRQSLALTPVPPPALPAADTQPPQIVLNYPPADTKVDRDAVLVTGLVTDDLGVGRVQIVVNGVEAGPAIEVKEGVKGVPVRANVALRPGDNLIEITATDRSGNVAQLVRTVTRLVREPPAGAGERLAVIIGIGAYDNRGIPRLQYAARDAEVMYEVLTTRAGFKKDNVILLTDQTGQRPTLRNIKSALGTFLARSAKKDDTVLVFFAGHGAPELDPRGIERDGLAKYLIPSDADPNDLYATALSMEEIQTIFGRIEAERVVMLVDSCYSGAAGGRTFVAQRVRTRDISIDDQFLDRLTRAKGRAIITAARTSEVALELSELGHGLFTYYVVLGLKGAADADKDGIVTLQELYDYVARQVAAKSRSVGGRQHPVMKGELEGPLPLVRLAPR